MVFESYSKFVSHIWYKHNIRSKDYYNQFLKKSNDGICLTCGRPTAFLNIQLGYRQYCSTKCVSNNPQIILQKIKNTNYANRREKSKQTCLRKYGVENPMQCLEIKQKVLNKLNEQKSQIQLKRRNTFIKKYNSTSPFGNKNVRNKSKETLQRNYNVCLPFESLQIRNKAKETLKRNYNVDNPFKSAQIRDKAEKTCFQKYGVKNISLLPATKIDIKTKLLKLAYGLVIKKYSEYEPMFKECEYLGYAQEYQWRCKKCNNIFKGRFGDNYELRCPVCFPVVKSSLEQTVYKWLSRFFQPNEIVQNSRSILLDKTDIKRELDFYIPSKNIAIEINGNFWHSEISGEKNKKYHINKTQLCQQKNIQLIQIFSDELQNKPQIVYARLKHILGKVKYSIYARKCVINEIVPQVKNKFLEKYHLQGQDKSQIKLGAFYKNKLVAVMTFSKLRTALGQHHQDGFWELSRFATISSFNIIGIGSKLLNYFKQKYLPRQIISYADQRWSQGKLYYKLGFQLSHISQPNYWYLKTNNYYDRIHRFNFRKNVLKDKLDKFDPNLSEWENMKIHGYDRIWDCGNLVFKYTL